MFKKFVIAYDHRVDEKTVERAKNALKDNNIDVVCYDETSSDNDYPVLASKAYQLFLKEKADGMLLMCGTGIGMNIVANKFDGIRSILATSEAEAYFSRRHENSNVIVFGVGYADKNFEVSLCRRKMVRMINVFLNTEFEGDRHIRRLEEISKIEKGGKF